MVTPHKRKKRPAASYPTLGLAQFLNLPSSPTLILPEITSKHEPGYTKYIHNRIMLLASDLPCPCLSPPHLGVPLCDVLPDEVVVAERCQPELRDALIYSSTRTHRGEQVL